MRAAAAEEQGKLLDARAVPALLRLAVSDPYTLSRHHAVTALGKMAVAMPVLSEDIRTGLQRVREGTDVNQQWLAANALGMLGDAGVAADITRVLRVSEDPHLAWQGLHSLAAIPGPETLPVAYEFVLHPDPAVAEQALRTCFAVAVKAAEPVAVATGDGTANVSLAEVMGDLAPGAGDLALRLLRQSSKRHPHEALRHKSLLLFQDAVGVMKEKLLAYEKAAASAAVLRAEAKAAKSEL
jgi:HEAT repeat protein